MYSSDGLLAVMCTLIDFALLAPEKEGLTAVTFTFSFIEYDSLLNLMATCFSSNLIGPLT